MAKLIFSPLLLAFQSIAINYFLLCTIKLTAFAYYTIPEDIIDKKEAECPDGAQPAPTLPFGGITLYQDEFHNWIGDLVVPGLWNVVPETPQDILDIINWAYKNDYKVRPSGFMHTWAPVTVSNHIINPDLTAYPDIAIDITKNRVGNKTFFKPKINTDQCPQHGKMIIVKTNETLTKMEMLPVAPQKSENSSYSTSASSSYPFPAVWVQSGATLENLLEFLEKYNYGINSHPATGHITLGGIMAIGGHGTGIHQMPEDTKEEIPLDHGYGSMSNLILEFTAIVWNRNSKKYIIQKFTRDNIESNAFITSMGRAFILDLTIKVAPITYLRCESHLTIPAKELFSNPAKPMTNPADSWFNVSSPARTLASFIESHGSVELILFPFTDYPWLKVWSSVPDKPLMSRHVTSPYNYPFSDTMSPTATNIVANMTLGMWEMTPVLSGSQYSVVTAGLAFFLSHDIWGSSRNLLLYVKSSTFRVGELGAAILTSRASIQRVLFESFSFYNNLIQEYAKKGKFPINGPLDVRVSGLDWADDIFTSGDRERNNSSESDIDDDMLLEAEAPGISPTSPYEKNKSFDVCIWFTVLTLPGTPHRSEFFEKLETYFYRQFEGTYALIRPEWSKGWAYSRDGSWRNAKMLKETIPQRFKNWEATRKTLNKYDPHRVFTNPFLDFLLP